jgi:hypothetical protein
MGTVFRALDRMTGVPVAVKVMDTRQDEQRFQREARLLAQVGHPAVVRYVAHGTTKEGSLFLAMEWLEGEDLADRTRRGGLVLRESLAVIKRVADGLAVAHERGVVHRDLKPSNIFLVGGDPGHAKILDFGVARDVRAARATQTGALVGSIGYMSPEQAAGAQTVDARSDVFALGCVLFELLTGRPAFDGDSFVAVLGKVLRADVPSVREIRPELPPAIDELVARLLAKSPDDRPADARAVGAALEALEQALASDGGVALGAAPAHVLTVAERRYVTVVIAELWGTSSAAETIDDANMSSLVRAAREELARFGASPTVMTDGLVIATMDRGGSASDRATLAAAAALALAEQHSSARIVVATGRAESVVGGPIGPAIDRAAGLLPAARDAAERGGSRVIVDDTTARLLEERFELEPSDETSFALLGRRAEGENARLFLGKPTPCVGRDRELAILEATFAQCLDEPLACGALITASAGTGKSRVASEIMARVAGRSRVLSARADPVSGGTALDLARQLVLRAAGDDLRAYLGARFKGDELARVADFLEHLLGREVSGTAVSGEMLAARNEPRLMHTWMERSLIAWLDAELREGPITLMFEDLHWADQASVALIMEALRNRARPLFVVMTARPEVHEIFPRLLASEAVHELRLGGLSKHAAQKLVESALGVDVPRELVDRILERAGGNAFYLEEIVRHVRSGAIKGLLRAPEDSSESLDTDISFGSALPETVLALAEARIQALEPAARRVLRAASVYGDQFTTAGIAALIGESDVQEWLDELVLREALEVKERGLSFRHDLLREAAYAMLTDVDRANGHRLAGTFLARSDARPLVVASHFERASLFDEALPWLERAAYEALEAGNLVQARLLCDKALAHGATGELRGRVLVAKAEVLGWAADFEEIPGVTTEALSLLEPGSNKWFVAAGGLVFSGLITGDPNLAAGVIGSIFSIERAPDPTGPYGFAMMLVLGGLVHFGQGDLARAFLAQVDAAASRAAPRDHAFFGWYKTGAAMVALYTGDLGEAYARCRDANDRHERAGNTLGKALIALYYATVLGEVGRFDEAIDVVLRCDAPAFRATREWEAGYRARLLTRAGDNQGTIHLLTTTESRDENSRLARVAMIADARLGLGDLEEAERRANEVLAAPLTLPVPTTIARHVLAAIAEARGDFAGALDQAERGLTTARELLCLSMDRSQLHIDRIRALTALGATERLPSAKADASAHRERTRSAIGNPDLLASYDAAPIPSSLAALLG